MWLKIWRFVTLLIVGLGLTLGGAHVLELPQKLQWGPELYASVNTTLYRYFGIVGAILTVGGILSGVLLCWMVRGRPSFPLTVAATLCLALSLGLWLALVAPVNNEVAHILRISPMSVPETWMRLRDRWEYGHVLAFLAWLLGFCFLQLSVLREVPDQEPVSDEATRPEAAHGFTPRSRVEA